MWTRRSFCDNGYSSRCTVKFVGNIPPWPDTVALGVEWDEPARGRNNGELNGLKYFSCRVPGAGSFVKASREHEEEESFGSAVFKKYVQRTDTKEELQLQLPGGKPAEIIGAEELQEKHERLEDLSVISVENSRVKSASSGVIDLSRLLFLERLDLSNNLFEHLSDITDLLSHLRGLRWLRLNGNRLQFGKFKEAPQIVTVEASNLLMTEDETLVLSACFPNALTLSLAQNRLTSVPQGLPPNLKTLDLSYNAITELDGLPTSLECALLAENGITKISRSEGLPRILDVRGQALDWNSISVLGRSEVEELHISHSQHTNEKIQRFFVVARSPHLRKLNGTEITSDERLDAELYTLSAVSKRKHPPLPHSRWAQIVEKYGEPASSPDRSIRARLITFYIDDNPNPLRIVRDATIPRLLRQVALATNTHMRNIDIKWHNDDSLESQKFGSHTTVEELIQEGDRIKVVIRPSSG